VALGVRSRIYFTSLVVVFFRATVESKTVADCSEPKPIVTEAVMAASCYFPKAVELAIGAVEGCSPMVAEVATRVAEHFSSMVAGQAAELVTRVVEHFSSMVAGQAAELAARIVEGFHSMVAKLVVRAASVEGCCSMVAGQVAEVATEAVEHFSSMLAELATRVVRGKFNSMVARLVARTAAVEGYCSITALATQLLVFSQVLHSFPIG